MICLPRLFPLNNVLSFNFIRKIKDIQYTPSNTILVTAEVVGLYPSIPHCSGLKALKNILDRRKN